MQVLVPLQVRVMQSVDVQVIDVPLQVPPKHASLYVHGSPSLHATPVRHSHVPPVLVQLYWAPPQLMVWQRVWFEALHMCTAPPEQIPSAPAAPQPKQDWPTINWLAVQVSGQAPSVVRQPPTAALQAASQHWLPAPTPHVVCAAAHEQGSQSPTPSQ